MSVTDRFSVLCELTGYIRFILLFDFVLFLINKNGEHGRRAREHFCSIYASNWKWWVLKKFQHDAGTPCGENVFLYVVVFFWNFANILCRTRQKRDSRRNDLTRLLFRLIRTFWYTRGDVKRWSPNSYLQKCYVSQ